MLSAKIAAILSDVRKRHHQVIMNKTISISLLLIILIGCAVAAYWYLNRGNYEPAPFWQPSNEGNKTSINHNAWQTVLDDFLISDDPSGVHLVDYQGLVEDPEPLNDYIKSLVDLDPRTYNRAEQFAYWVNLYNALTMQVVVKNYPAKTITKISASGLSFGPWDDTAATIAGQDVSLNDIEHRILRAYWKDHRIHFAVNCASIGCPNVQPTAFTAQNTENLLVGAAREYLQHPRGLRIDGQNLVLSSIFDWYKSDFGSTDQEVLTTLSQYLNNSQRDEVMDRAANISYEYDWALNEAQL